MKKRSAIIVAIVFMIIGFAAVSTSLIINGNVKVSENNEDFSVIFTKATLDGTDVYSSIVDDTKKTITFTSKDLKKIGDKSTLTYEVTNNSANYDAEVSVTCVSKDGTTAKYTSIKNELENNATVVKAKEALNGTLTIILDKQSTEEVNEEYTCSLEFNATERDELGDGIPSPATFATDSWETIQKAVKTGKTSKYNVGDTKEINLTNFGTHTVRISNMSACTNGETSETACGFVVEFADIVTTQPFNRTNTNVGGWKNSSIRTYINGTLYNSLPSELQNVISTTKVISGHGKSESANIETEDKLYLLSTKEIHGTKHSYDSLDSETKQFDYYNMQGVTSSNPSGAIKQYNGGNLWWLLRSVNVTSSYPFLGINNKGTCDHAVGTGGVSPAFRIG